MNFIDHNPSLETYWRSIILLGRNVASYKFSLAKTLLEIPKNKTEITLEDLALPFALNICDHLKTNDKQHTGPSNKFLSFCREYNKNQVNDNELKKHSIKHGFTYVLDAFHNVAGGEVPRFFENVKNSNRGIILTDNFYKLFEGEQEKNLNLEVNSRWKLWETAISLKINPNLVEINSDLQNEVLYIFNDKNRRIDVTSSRDGLNGYQKGKCFYCQRNIQIEKGYENSCDVDHFFPHRLKSSSEFLNINQVWNLVLSCKECNRGTLGKFDKIPEIIFVENLNKRNNYYIESHHPLRETILNQTGRTINDRKIFLNKFYKDAVNKIPTKWKPKEIFRDNS